MNEVYTYKKINDLALDPVNFINGCSTDYHGKVDKVAEKIFADANKKIVMLAGPSSSGKTTTASILSQHINLLGGRAYTVSLDDFYHPRSVGYPLDENGKPVSNELLSDVVEFVKPHADSMADRPTEFELISAIGFEIFNIV